MRVRFGFSLDVFQLRLSTNPAMELSRGQSREAVKWASGHMFLSDWHSWAPTMQPYGGCEVPEWDTGQLVMAALKLLSAPSEWKAASAVGTVPCVSRVSSRELEFTHLTQTGPPVCHSFSFCKNTYSWEIYWIIGIFSMPFINRMIYKLILGLNSGFGINLVARFLLLMLLFVF